MLDNRALILEDPRLREATVENLDLILRHTYWWPHGEAGLYRPVSTLSYLVNYAVLGNADQPAGYHCVNLLLHAGNVLLVYFLARQFLRGFWPPVFAAGLWAVHPVLTESVTNIVGRADLLSATAILGALLLYLKSTEARGRWLGAWLACLAAVTTVGVFAKETGVVIPGVMALYELSLWRGRKRVRGFLLGCAAALPPLALVLYARTQVIGASARAAFPFLDNPIVSADFWSGRATAAGVMGRYLGLLAWPARLSTDYSYAQIPPAGGVREWIDLAGLLAAGAAVAWLYRVNRAAFFFAGFALVTLLPVSNLLFPTGTIMAERFLYLPSVGLTACFVMAVYGASERMRLKRAAPAVLCAMGLACTARTWARNTDWRDDVTLARTAVAACPRSFKAHKILAAALLASDPGHGNIDEVIQQAEESVAVIEALPDHLSDAAAYRLAGAAHLLKNNTLADERALLLLQKCARIAEAEGGHPNPNDDVHRLLAVAYLRLGRPREALRESEAALGWEPMNPEVYRQLSGAMAANGRPDDAAVALMEGVFLTSDQSLRQDLLKLYSGGLDATGCATMPGPDGPALNPACPSVHQDLCRAATEAIRVSLRAGRQDIAGALQRGAAAQLGCRGDVRQ